jgi:hypothetical protein
MDAVFRDVAAVLVFTGSDLEERAIISNDIVGIS